MSREMPKQYDPKLVEGRIYDFWMDGGWFPPCEDNGKEPFTIVIPPPNVTGQLHLGHAFDNTMQDVLIRFKRMQGYPTLWVPGTDHAGIATQIKVEEALREGEGITRHDLGREKFLERVWQWKEKYGGRIIEQLKLLGSSCDWSRLRFTMDEGLSRAVREVFVSLYEKGLIYRGYRIINWCPSCRTALSDAEVEYEEREGHLWHVRYPLADGSGYITVATTRPETMLGDTAVAVNPKDERYKNLIGKTVILPLMNREIPIVADDYVEMDFGTGCVKITPCHDPNDFEVAKRHDLPELLIMDEDGHINQNGGKYAGLSREDARKSVITDLEAEGALCKTETHMHNVGECHRCHNLVEPMASMQWFVKMKPLAEPAMESVRSGRVRFSPDRFSKLYMNWMENVRDWCISRQLWWGHRIPVWYCSDCGHENVLRDDPETCVKCGSQNLKQDSDVLDTWFSSALWPFSTLGWPDDTEDLRRFYPTSVLVTAYDIIFFWVARMIFSGVEHMGQEPFKVVFMHGLLRDNEGRKMSKSSGNGVDPIEMINKYGADALRFNIVTMAGSGNDMRFYEERCEAMRNFCNKLWNASRFVLMNLDNESEWTLPDELDLSDMWILTKLQAVIRSVTDNLDVYEPGLAAQKLYDFLWDDFCDWYIELCKARLQSENKEARQTAQQVLCYVLETALRLLHPFTPFITEEIWQSIPHEGEALIIAQWPELEERFVFDSEAESMEKIMSCIRAVRALRNEMKVPPSKKVGWIIVTSEPDLFASGKAYFQRLASAGEITITANAPEDSGMVCAVTTNASIYLPLAELVDIEAEKKRLGNELIAAEKEYDTLRNKLSNEGFTSKAPEKVVAAERERYTKLSELINNLREGLKRL